MLVVIAVAIIIRSCASGVLVRRDLLGGPTIVMGSFTSSSSAQMVHSAQRARIEVEERAKLPAPEPTA